MSDEPVAHRALHGTRRPNGGPEASGISLPTTRRERVTMTNHEDSVALDEYRNLLQKMENNKKRIQEVKALLRQQMDKLASLEGAARESRDQYHRMLKQDASQGGEGGPVTEAKRTFASKEADLAEARAILESLEAELPKLEASLPHHTEMEAARRGAWLAISRDVQARVARETHEILAQAYAALLEHSPEATFQMVLTAIFSAAPSRQECGQLVERLAKEYNV